MAGLVDAALILMMEEDMDNDKKMIIYEKQGKIARVTLNRPEARNALNPQMLREYLDTLDEADNDHEVGAIIVTGAGKAFSAGLDLKYARNQDGAEHRLWLKTFYWEMNDKVRSLSKPIIACLNGAARAGGCLIAFTCDMIIAADSASLGFPEVIRGITNGVNTWYVPRLVGRMKAAELFFTGDPISAAEAERIGLVNRAVPDERLEEETIKLASKIAGMPPISLKLIRECIYGTENLDFHSAVRVLEDKICLAFDTVDSKEGRRAFIEKRKPSWQGR